MASPWPRPRSSRAARRWAAWLFPSLPNAFLAVSYKRRCDVRSPQIMIACASQFSSNGFEVPCGKRPQRPLESGCRPPSRWRSLVLAPRTSRRAYYDGRKADDFGLGSHISFRGRRTSLRFRFAARCGIADILRCDDALKSLMLQSARDGSAHLVGGVSQAHVVDDDVDRVHGRFSFLHRALASALC